MEVQDLNDIANDIAVSRLEVSSLEQKRDELIAANPELVAVNAELQEKKIEKESLTNQLLHSMKEAQLKAWKTDEASFSRASRKTVVLDPDIKKRVETRVKNGEEVPGWSLVEKEYISVRVTPKS